MVDHTRVPYPVQVLWGGSDPILALRTHGMEMLTATGLDAMTVVEGRHYLQEEAATQIAEAVRRHRAETSPDDLFVERLLGIRLGAEQTARGKVFVQGVVDRAGETGLAPLFSDPAAVPTPNEIEAPGLWLARVAGDEA